MFGSPQIPLDIYKEIIKFLSPEDMLRLCSANRFFNSNKKALCVSMVQTVMRNMNQVHDVFLRRRYSSGLYGSGRWFFVKGQGDVWIYHQKEKHSEQLLGIDNVKQVWVPSDRSMYCLQKNGKLFKGTLVTNNTYTFELVCENVSDLCSRNGEKYLYLIIKTEEGTFKQLWHSQWDESTTMEDVNIQGDIQNEYSFKAIFACFKMGNDISILALSKDNKLIRITNGQPQLLASSSMLYQSVTGEIYCSDEKGTIFTAPSDVSKFVAVEGLDGVQKVHVALGMIEHRRPVNGKAWYPYGFYLEDGKAWLREMHTGKEKSFPLDERVIDIYRDREDLIFVLEHGRLFHLEFKREQEKNFHLKGILPTAFTEINTESLAMKKLCGWYEKEVTSKNPAQPSAFSSFDEQSSTATRPSKQQKTITRG